MGKKYIIELLDDCPSEFKGIIVFGLKPEGQISAEPIPVEDLTPYTEPEPHAEVTADAYQRGYEAGLNDAWEAARTLWNTAKRKEIFGYTVFSTALMSLTGQEAIEKIRQYEQEKEEIKVGDEVVSEDDIKAVVIDMDDYLLHVLDENGVVQGWPREDVAKTDRHFPEIAAVLEKMKEA